MGFEDVRTLKTKPDGAAAQEGVFLLGQVQGGHQLVPAKIQGSDDHAVRSHGLCHVPVRLKLVLLSGKPGPVQVKKLGPEQADPFRAALVDLLHLVGEFDVCRQNDVASIGRGRLGFAQLVQLFLDLRLLDLQLAILPERLLVRVEDHDTVVSVQKDVVPVVHLLTEIVQPHHRRDVQ